LSVLGAVAVAGAISGGVFELIKTLSVSSGGGVGGAGGAFTLDHSVGQPNATTMTGGLFSLTSGYHGEITAAGPVPTVATVTIPATALVTGLPMGVPVNAAPTITFSDPMDSATLAGAVTLHATRNKLAGAIYTAIPFSVSYDPLTYVLTVTPTSPLDTNTLYVLQISTAAHGSGGEALASASSYSLLTLFDHTATNAFVNNDGLIQLLAPPGTFAADGYIVIKDDPLHAPDKIDPAIIVSADNAIVSGYGPSSSPVLIREINAYNAANQRVNLSAANIASITAKYVDDGNGLVFGSAPPVRSAALALWVLDEAQRVWTQLPNGARDAAAQTVTAPIPHISVFALLGASAGDVSQAFAYPVPWKPRSSDPTRYGTLAGGVTFSSLPPTATIKIYTVSGSLVKSIDHSNGSPTETWLGLNSDGSPVGSGVYLWTVESDGHHKNGKLMVVW
jgi:hypothetical protein